MISRDEVEHLGMPRLDGCGRVHFPFIQFAGGSLEIFGVKGSWLAGKQPETILLVTMAELLTSYRYLADAVSYKFLLQISARSGSIGTRPRFGGGPIQISVSMPAFFASFYSVLATLGTN